MRDEISLLSGQALPAPREADVAKSAAAPLNIITAEGFHAQAGRNMLRNIRSSAIGPTQWRQKPGSSVVMPRIRSKRNGLVAVQHRLLRYFYRIPREVAINLPRETFSRKSRPLAILCEISDKFFPQIFFSANYEIQFQCRLYFKRFTNLT